MSAPLATTRFDSAAASPTSTLPSVALVPDARLVSPIETSVTMSSAPPVVTLVVPPTLTWFSAASAATVASMLRPASSWVAATLARASSCMSRPAVTLPSASEAPRSATSPLTVAVCSDISAPLAATRFDSAADVPTSTLPSVALVPDVKLASPFETSVPISSAPPVKTLVVPPTRTCASAASFATLAARLRPASNCPASALTRASSCMSRPAVTLPSASEAPRKATSPLAFPKSSDSLPPLSTVRLDAVPVSPTRTVPSVALPPALKSALPSDASETMSSAPPAAMAVLLPMSARSSMPS